MSIRAPLARTLALSIAASLAFALGGCGSGRSVRMDLDVPANVEASGRIIGVDVENFRGAVTIRVEPWRKGVEVRASKRVSGGADEGAGAFLKAETLTAEFEQSDTGPATLRIRSWTDRPEASDHRADILVLVPECDGVRIRTAQGKVYVNRAGGAMQIENIDGPIDIRTDSAIVDPILLTTTSGDIYLACPVDSAALLDARTDDGEVTIDSRAVSATDWSLRGDGKRLEGVINGGANPVTIRTGKGDIEIEFDEDPLSSRGLLE